MRSKAYSYFVYIFCLITFFLKEDPAVFLFGIMHLLFDVVLVLKEENRPDRVRNEIASAFDSFTQKVYGRVGKG